MASPTPSSRAPAGPFPHKGMDMIGSSIVAVMETTLIAMQAVRVMVLPFVVLLEDGSANHSAEFLPDFSSDDLRTIIRENESQCQSSA
jgi:hypothetical protein